MTTPPAIPLITILSPHQDDAAFSLAGWIATQVSMGAGVRVINCFTLSEHTPYRDGRDRRSAVEIRAAEDRAALRALGIDDVIDLGFLDAPLRLGVDVQAVCDADVGRRDDSALVPRLAGAIAALLRAEELVLGPVAGPTAHVDHRAVRDAALLLTSAHLTQPESPMPPMPPLSPVAHVPHVGWYEDLPYAARDRVPSSDANNLPVFMHPLTRDLESCYVQPADGGRAKRAIAAMYRSQVVSADIELLDVDGARRGYAERVWLPAGSSLRNAGAVGAR